MAILAPKIERKTLSPQSTYPDFRPSFIYWALGLAFFGGFAIAGHMSYVMGFDYPLRASHFAFIQVHGHLQLLGWTGFFIFGISLFYLPRLASGAVNARRRIPLVLWLLAGGLTVESLLRCTLPYLSSAPLFSILSHICLAASILQAFGILLYLSIQGQVALCGQRDRASLRPLFPLLGLALTAWLIFASGRVYLLWDMVQRESYLTMGWGTQLLNDLFFFALILPLCMAFTLRFFPLYLRLEATSWWKSWMGVTFLLLVALGLVTSPWNNDWSFSYLSQGAKGGVGLFLIAFIFRLGLPARLLGLNGSHRQKSKCKHKKNRGGVENFGSYHKLLYSAYFWLFIAAALEVTYRGFQLTGQRPFFTYDLVRHLYLLGFVTPLIMGMAVRMIPGMAGARKISASPLVELMFWTINFSIITRILPFFDTFGLPPVWQRYMNYLFGYSGMVGMAALLLLAIVLIRTIRQGRSSAPPQMTQS